jgi:hypothetical protein
MAKQRFHLVPHSKLVAQKRKEKMAREKYDDLNDERLMERNLRYAGSIARGIRSAAEVEAFDKAAANLPKPTPYKAAVFLERAPLILRDMEPWEAEWLAMQEEKVDATAKEYPKAYTDRVKALTQALDDEDDVASAKCAATGVAGTGGGLDAFYAADEGEDDEEDEAAEALAMEPADRVTDADKVGDQRSLDRRLSDRLVLLVRRSADGEWGFPTADLDVSGAAPMVRSAESAMVAAVGDAMHVWWPGAAPVCHMNRVYGEEQSAQSGAYGERLFFFRGELLRGFPVVGGDYDDHRWVTRTEAAEFLPKDVWEATFDALGMAPTEVNHVTNGTVPPPGSAKQPLGPPRKQAE